MGGAFNTDATGTGRVRMDDLLYLIIDKTHEHVIQDCEYIAERE